MQTIKIKLLDYLIVGSLLLTGIFGFLYNLNVKESTINKYVLIYVKNEQIAELSLPPGKAYNYSFAFGDHKQHMAELEINDGHIRMLPLPISISPRQIHAHTGWIEHPYQSIVCLPNQIVISFKETQHVVGEYVIDGVTY